MLVISYKTTAMIGLLLEQEKTRYTKMANLDHEVVEGLIVLTIETFFWIAVHVSWFLKILILMDVAIKVTDSL